MKKRIMVGLLLLCLLSVAAIPSAQAIDLGSILKVGVMGIVIDKFATPLNNFINDLMMKNNAGTDYATKVVPILTVGTGGYVGAAQVTGPQELIERTEAVIQIEGNFNGNQFRIKGLIPIDSKNPTNFSRVQGVGVSAMIDIRI
ncbi:MAG: hypothetical protein H6Q66_65 [Firmicutes bacterium]|nr:hypothetical protein [Bacillota bacterium]